MPFRTDIVLGGWHYFRCAEAADYSRQVASHRLPAKGLSKHVFRMLILALAPTHHGQVVHESLFPSSGTADLTLVNALQLRIFGPLRSTCVRLLQRRYVRPGEHLVNPVELRVDRTNPNV